MSGSRITVDELDGANILADRHKKTTNSRQKVKHHFVSLKLDKHAARLVVMLGCSIDQ
jgi:hypothetical protein